ncbi:hypothetical protein [Massilia pseudoviolaceinigra]|uniref:hypothetical protein n=1 Tax=Massilia pseudoviolaceinigra TaxID=3057165 RepID=UPI002796C5A4|nr:hypothetical protein [Massilia sp. CCM 9206]MDQ1921056.1 hypothetical protein [Massilia sp. CCM 9206]
MSQPVTNALPSASRNTAIQFSRALRAALATACLMGMSLAHAQMAQTSTDQNVPAATARQQAAEIARGDPARWSREDTTPDARLRTLRKEMGAALQEAKGACRALPAAERSACNKEAQANYQKDMAGARARAAAGG